MIITTAHITPNLYREFSGPVHAILRSLCKKVGVPGLRLSGSILSHCAKQVGDKEYEDENIIPSTIDGNFRIMKTLCPRTFVIR